MPIDTKRSFLRLKFSSAQIEKDFQLQSSRNSLRAYQISLGLGVLTVLGYYFVDLWALPLSHSLAFNLRFYLIFPVTALTFALTFTKKYHEHSDWGIIIPGSITGGAIAMMMAFADPSERGYLSYYAGILVVNVWITNIFKARLKPSLITSLINTIFYLVTLFYFQNVNETLPEDQIKEVWSNLVFYFSITSVNVLGSWMMEVYSRNEFLQNLQILENQEKFLSANRLSALGEMAANVAHEINTPLQVILIGSERIEKDLISNNVKLPPSIEKMPQRIVLATRRIDKIIKSLRVVSRDGSKDPFVIEKLETLIQDATYFCVDKFQRGGIDLKIETPPSVYVNCRITEISQVILNLLNNSYDAIKMDKSFNSFKKMSSPLGSDPTAGSQALFQGSAAFKLNETEAIDYQNQSRNIEKPWVQIQFLLSPDLEKDLMKEATLSLKSSSQVGVAKSENLKNKKLFIEIKDNGPGVPEEIQSKMMKAFFTTKPAGQGTGIGLSLSKQIIESHGGELVYIPSQGRGAHFRVVLPLMETPFSSSDS